jgi:hypothetical protein
MTSILHRSHYLLEVWLEKSMKRMSQKKKEFLHGLERVLAYHGISMVIEYADDILSSLVRLFLFSFLLLLN